MAQNNGVSLAKPAAMFPSGQDLKTPFVIDYDGVKRDFKDREGKLEKRLHNWQRANGALLLLLGIAVVGYVIAPPKVKYLPYIVETAQTGQVRTVGILPQAWQGQTTPPIEQALKDWLYRMRRVGTDQVLLGEQWQAAGAFMTTKVLQMAKGHFEAQVEKVKKNLTTQIEIRSLLPVTQDWHAVEMEWTEKTYSQNGMLMTTEPWKVIVNVGLYPVTEVTTGQQIKNPLGIFVTDYAWTKK